MVKNFYVVILLLALTVTSCGPASPTPSILGEDEMNTGSKNLINFAYEKPEEEYLKLIDGLISDGGDINAQTSYGETPLKVSFNQGKAAAVRKLLELGADPSVLGWDNIHIRTALGSLENLQAHPPQPEELVSRTAKGLTPFLMAVHLGHIEMAKYLLPLTSEAGRYSASENQGPLLIASRHARLEMSRWLLEEGFDARHSTPFGETALHTASEVGSVELVDLLLEAGADAHAEYNLSASLRARPTYKPDEFESDHDTIFTPMENAGSGAIVLLLHKAGASLKDISQEARRELTGASNIPRADISRGDFEHLRARAYGKQNPELSTNPFWMEQVRTGNSAYRAFANLFGESKEPAGDPIWSFDRYGTSLTALPEGHWLEIAGEHEDWYDRDFCIYNDVVVHDGQGNTQIYTYPKSVFPNTDFHSATLVGDSIFIIGNLGYQNERRVGMTPVYRLELSDYSIREVQTSGENPGWISGHEAELDGSSITIKGGEIWDGTELHDTQSAWKLDMRTFKWTKQ